jgi:hypothetical protein
MEKKGKCQIFLCQEVGKIRMFEYCQQYRFVCSTNSWKTPVNSSTLRGMLSWLIEGGTLSFFTPLIAPVNG